MTRSAHSIWRRIAANLPAITFAIAVAVTIATALWVIWSLRSVW